MEENKEGLFGIRLGQEELVVLLGVLRASTLPGLGEDPLGGVSEEQREAALGAAERSLRARGLIAVDAAESRVEVEPLTLALLGTCVYPRYTISFAALDKTGNIDAAYYHGRDDFLVEHSFPEPGICEFLTAAGKEAMHDRLMHRMGLAGGPAPAGKPFKVPLSGMEEARELAKAGKREEIIKVLAEKGMGREEAEMVTAIFESSTRSFFMVRADYGETPDETRGEGIALLEQDGGYWLMSGDADREDRFNVEPVSSKEAEARVREFISAVGGTKGQERAPA